MRQVPEEKVERLAQQDQEVKPVQLAEMAVLVPVESPEPLDQLEVMDSLDLLDQQVNEEKADHVVRLDQEERQARLEQQAAQVAMGALDPVVKPALRAHVVSPVEMDNLELEDHEESLDPEEKLELLVLLDLLDSQVTCE